MTDYRTGDNECRVWFTSDTHFGHANIIQYCKRPFSSVEEMDEILIANWNSKVKPSDEIYVLGDFCWHDPAKYVKRLNGSIHLIAGNHDKEASSRRDLFRSIHPILKIKVKEQHIILCHFSLRTWDASHYGSYHLFGHTHSVLPPWGKSLDVGVDVFNFNPVSFEEINSIMANRPETPKPFEDIGPFKEHFWYKIKERNPIVSSPLLLWDGSKQSKGTVDYTGALLIEKDSGYKQAQNITHWMYCPDPPKGSA